MDKQYRVLMAFGFMDYTTWEVRNVVPGDIITSADVNDERAAVMLEQGCIELVTE